MGAESWELISALLLLFSELGVFFLGQFQSASFLPFFHGGEGYSSSFPIREIMNDREEKQRSKDEFENFNY